MPPIIPDETSPQQIDTYADDGDTHVFTKRGCCFWLPCLRSRRSDPNTAAGSGLWERIRASEKQERWWSRSWSKVRDWSEIVAGPKWKTFIRRFNKNRSHGNGGYAVRHGKFHYDPLSYSLNFDDGQGQDGNLDEFRDFSARYAPVSAKSSMDLGKDGPSFT